MAKHKVRQVGHNLYECTVCGAEAEGWLPMPPDCVPQDDESKE